MKIYPIINNHNRLILNEQTPLPTNKITGREEISDVKTINFQAKLTPVFIKDMQKLKNVRCPICNTKMLNQEELNTAFQDIQFVKNGEGLRYFLAKYKENINPMFDRVITALLATIALTPDEASDTILENLNIELRQNTENKIEQLKNSFIELANTPETPEESKTRFLLSLKKIDNLSDDVSRMNYYKHLTNIVRKTLSGYSGKEKHAIYSRLVDIYKQAVFEENLLIQAENYEVNLTEFFCKKLLSHSMSELRKTFPEETATTENMFLSCALCEASDKKFLYNVIYNKDVYYNYVYDMSHRALAGEIPSNQAYPLELSENVRSHNSRISADLFQEDLNKLYNTLGLTPQKNLNLPIVDEPGTPCAYCGKTTITHKEKQELYLKIANATSLQEMLDIANSRKEVIKSRYLPILDYAEKLGSNINNIDEQTFFTNLREHTWNEIYKKLYNTISELNKIASEHKLIGKDWYEIKTIIRYFEDKLKEPVQNNLEMFPIFNLKDFLIEHTTQFKDRKEINDAVWDTCYEPLLDEYQLQKILTPIDSVTEKLGSGLKAMFQTIFKRSVATIEHLDPKLKYVSTKENPNQYNNYLANRKANLVVACHECNIRKKATDLRLWVANIPSTITHFKEYLKYAKNLQKTKDFKYNVYEVAAQFKKLTGKDLLPLD